MAYPASHLWWCQLSVSSVASPGFLGSLSSHLLEITSVQSVSTNWQIVPSDDVYYHIRNEAAGPHFQLGLSSQLSTSDAQPILVSINVTREQQWAFRPDGEGVLIQNVALGDLGFLNVSSDGFEPSFDGWGKSEGMWNIKQVKMIDDASFLTSTQVWFLLNDAT
jgi:hypothetical protein